jgi:hypothetical protein
VGERPVRLLQHAPSVLEEAFWLLGAHAGLRLPGEGLGLPRGQDPRDELAFQNQLADYAQLLRQQGGGVTKAWKPGPPPPEWAPK